jgi:hypothetical protein
MPGSLLVRLRTCARELVLCILPLLCSLVVSGADGKHKQLKPSWLSLGITIRRESRRPHELPLIHRSGPQDGTMSGAPSRLVFLYPSS